MERHLFEIVELTRDCELGVVGERAVVASLDGDLLRGPYRTMTLVFPNRARHADRVVRTGADYNFLRRV